MNPLRKGSLFDLIKVRSTSIKGKLFHWWITWWRKWTIYQQVSQIFSGELVETKPQLKECEYWNPSECSKWMLILFCFCGKKKTNCENIIRDSWWDVKNVYQSACFGVCAPENQSMQLQSCQPVFDPYVELSSFVVFPVRHAVWLSFLHPSPPLCPQLSKSRTGF